MDYQLWVVAHILAAGYWLGTDLAVYWIAGRIVDPTLPPAVRGFCAKAMLLLDMVPRTCLILTLAIGLTLAARLGSIAPLAPWLPLLWLAALAWLALAWTVFRLEHSPRGHQLARLDFGLRVLIALGCAALAVDAGRAGGWIPAQGWLAAKLGIFAAIIALGLVIRVQLRPFGALYARTLASDATAADHAALRRLIARVKLPVWAIWIGLVVAVVLGRTKYAF